MTRDQKIKLKSALLSFKQGNFNKSRMEFSEIMTVLPDNKTVILYNGYIALLENRLKDAVEYLQKALLMIPRSKAAKSLLADAYYRQDDFKNAAFFMNSLKQKQQAAKLEYLQDKSVYEISSPTNKIELDFLIKEPLPLIKVSINGEPPVNFLIDTGGGELIINTEYAKSLGLKESVMEKQTFGGGRKGAVINSCIDYIHLGDLQVKNLPVILMDTSKFSCELYGDKFKVDGILGTCMFYHFLTTLDYKNNKITFEILNDNTKKIFEDRLKIDDYQHIQFWMAGDHFILARGRANNSDEMLFFVDTGLGGKAFTCPKSTLGKCGFTLLKEASGKGIGGGGKYKVTPFDIKSLSLGSISRENLHGAYGPFPPSIENGFGFKLDGLISHEFFNNSTVIFDFSRMMLYVK